MAGWSSAIHAFEAGKAFAPFVLVQKWDDEVPLNFLWELIVSG